MNSENMNKNKQYVVNYLLNSKAEEIKLNSKLKFKFDIQHVIYFNNKDNDSRIIFIKSFLTLMSSSSFNSVII